MVGLENSEFLGAKGRMDGMFWGEETECLDRECESSTRTIVAGGEGKCNYRSLVLRSDRLCIFVFRRRIMRLSSGFQSNIGASAHFPAG